MKTAKIGRENERQRQKDHPVRVIHTYIYISLDYRVPLCCGHDAAAGNSTSKVNGK